MALSERLQPSLLDRLTDDEPEQTRETAERRFLSTQRLRDALKRDLGWLLNATSLGSLEDLEAYPQAARSVLNFGIPDLTGTSLSGVRVDVLETLIRQAVLDFEPRLLPRSLKVRVVADRAAMGHNAVRFDIEGELWAQPAPQRMLLHSEIDFETGHVKVEESGAAGSG